MRMLCHDWMRVWDNNNRKIFYVDFLLVCPLEYIFEETLVDNFLVYHGYMQKVGCSETCVHLCHYHNYKNLMINQDQLNGGK